MRQPAGSAFRSRSSTFGAPKPPFRNSVPNSTIRICVFDYMDCTERASHTASPRVTHAFLSSRPRPLFEPPLTHLPRRPYKCTFCPAAFSTPSVLGYHLDAHRGRSFACELCGLQFRQNYSLNKHRLTHQPPHQQRAHACPHCARGFRTAEGLRNHVGQHTGEARFACGICPARFSCTASSSLHRRRHLVDGAYECGRCGQRERTFAPFKSHLAACAPERLML